MGEVQYDPFGKAEIVQNTSGDEFVVNLRLPGQYYDNETGTHYSINRDYDPLTGRFLTSDPLGVADGSNTYTYVENDPLNRIDPLGLYGENIHYYMVNFLANVAGLDADTVSIISSASEYIDHNSLTSPMTLQGITSGSLENYHFILPRNDSAGNAIYSYRNPTDPQLDRLRNAAMNFNFDGCTIHRQSTRNVKAQLFGEYLHAYADTYGHRDPRNNPYSPTSDRGGLGHALDLTMPDRTYNFRVWIEIPMSPVDVYEEWNYQEGRTLEAERQMFYMIRQDFRDEIESNLATSMTDADYQAETDRLWRLIAGDGNAQIGQQPHFVYQQAQGVTGVLQEYNAEIDDQEKRRILGEWLILTRRVPSSIIHPQDAISAFDESTARNNRDTYLDGFEPGDLPGVLLPRDETEPEVMGP
ncbi:MAG: RHS repeat-associated core domain-containing protein [Candidatus Thiodiazotropha sp. (ex Lucinoma borealis)]|nr:RHS repeat-associated core domain-containing protein [Candidatus Thiodiazotropha sp. (ex Lucinoma borealis)]